MPLSLEQVLRDWVTPALTQAGFERRGRSYRRVDSRGLLAVRARHSPRSDHHVSFQLDAHVSPAAYLRYEYRGNDAALDSWRPADAVGLLWSRLTHMQVPGADVAPTAVQHAGGLLVSSADRTDLWTFPKERDEVYAEMGGCSSTNSTASSPPATSS